MVRDDMDFYLLTYILISYADFLFFVLWVHCMGLSEASWDGCVAEQAEVGG
jgi:hypothetical protein